MQGGWSDPLTRREAECLRLVAVLHTNDAIARRLDLSTNTVKNHVKAARDKLGGLGRYDAARRYAELLGAASDARGEGEAPPVDSFDPVDVDGPTAAAHGGAGAAEVAPAARRTGLQTARLRETRAVYRHETAGFASSPAASQRIGAVPLRRILAIPALAALLAVLIVATPPMARSFERLAALVKPFFG